MTLHGRGRTDDPEATALAPAHQRPLARRLSERLPGDDLANCEVERTDGGALETHCWRCRKCGEERNRRDELAEEYGADR